MMKSIESGITSLSVEYLVQEKGISTHGKFTEKASI